MSDLIVKQEADLRQLAKRINEEHAECERALKDGLQHAVEAGKLLIEAKKQCEHGKWLPWIKESCEFSARTAQGYMRVSNKLLDDGNAQRVAHLSFRQVMVELSESAVGDEVSADFEVLKDVFTAALLAGETGNMALVDSAWEDIDRTVEHLNARGEEWLEAIGRCDDLDEVQGYVDRARRYANICTEFDINCRMLLGRMLTELEARFGCKLPTKDGRIDLDLIELIGQTCRERAAELEAVGA